MRKDGPPAFVFPFSVDLSATTTTATASLQISTTASASSALVPGTRPNNTGYFAASAGLALAGIFLLIIPGPRGRRTALVELALLVLSGAALFGCAGGGSGGATRGGSSQVNLGTPSGSYTATIVASSGDRTQTTTVLLTVQ